MSTYAARLRLGHTALVTPVPTGHLVGASSSATGGPQSARRGGGRVRYAEVDESDDDSLSGMVNPVQQQHKMLARRPIVKSPHAYYAEEELLGNALRDEWLVPIRLDIDLDTHRIRDCFMWNLNDELLSPEKFAEIMCQDLDLPTVIWGPAIAACIQSQLQELEQLAEIQVDEEQETRLIISLDIHAGSVYLRDKFEWDLTSKMSPEEFAKILCRDLGLAGELPLLVAHAIREQTTAYHRARVYGDNPTELGHAGLDSDELLRRGELKSVYRSMQEAEMWTPLAEELTSEEMERVWAEQERRQRRHRRDIVASRYTVRPRAAVAGAGGQVAAMAMAAATPVGVRRTASAASAALTTATKRREGKSSKLTDEERINWVCGHCGAIGRETLLARTGPDGPRTLCNACGLGWQLHGVLPANRKDMFRSQ